MPDIDRFRPEDKRGAEGLYRRVFGIDAAEASRLRWDWQYRNNPAARRGEPLIWVAALYLMVFLGGTPFGGLRLIGEPGENVACMHRGTILDREHRARRQHVARGLGLFALLATFLAQQGEARTQVFLLGAARGAILGDDALGDAGGFVDALFQGLVLGKVLVLHDARLLGDDRQGERIPLGQAIAFLHLGAVLEHQDGTVRHFVDFALAALGIEATVRVVDPVQYRARMQELKLRPEDIRG